MLFSIEIECFITDSFFLFYTVAVDGRLVQPDAIAGAVVCYEPLASSLGKLTLAAY